MSLTFRALSLEFRDQSLTLQANIRNTCVATAMLNVRLDAETEQYLADLLAREKTDKSELVRRLIRERWLAQQAGQTVVERLGGHPQHLLQGGPVDLSERENRKPAIAQYL